MSRKKGEDLAERAANLALRYTELEDRYKCLIEDHNSLEKHYEESMRNAASLRSQLEDMRKQRDMAFGNADGAEMRLRDKQIDLARCLGWIDAKMDRPPHVDTITEIPF
jgi:chromosome segregation ATPase